MREVTIMIDSGIMEFLKSVGAIVPTEFETDLDDALLLLADDLSHSELVANAPDQNIEYSPKRAKLPSKTSISDAGEPLSIPGELPIHRRGVEI